MNIRKTRPKHLAPLTKKQVRTRVLCVIASIGVLMTVGQIPTTKQYISTSVSTKAAETVQVVHVEEHPVAKPPVDEVIPVEVEEAPAVKEVVEEIKEEYYGLTDEEIDLIALVTMAESEGECELGKRLVIDTILNRVDSKRFPNDVHGVIYQKHQFTSMWNGRVDRCRVRDDIRQLVCEELINRTNYECLYFRTDHYHNFGTPLFQVESHYFSGC